MIKLINYSTDFRYSNAKYFIKDSELINLNNDILNCNDTLIAFKIKQYENLKEGYNNPVIEFCILGSVYNIKKDTIKDYENKLFQLVRNMFKEVA